MKKEYDETDNEEDDIIDFKVIDGTMYLSFENVNKSVEKAVESYKNVIDKAREYIRTHLKQDTLSDFTVTAYIQEYMSDPDGLLDILKEK